MVLSGNTLDAESGDDVPAGLCRGQEHLHVRRGCIGVQQRVAATGHLDRDRRVRHTGGGFGDAEFGIGASQTFALQYSDTAGAASLQNGVGVFQRDASEPASNSCVLYYNASTNQMNLLGNNGGTRA